MSLRFARTRIRMIRGLTWRDTIQLIDQDTGAPVSLVGVTSATMRVRTSIGSSTVTMELSTTNNRLAITDAALGKIGIAVSAEDTLAFPINNHKRRRYPFDTVLSRGGDPEVLEPANNGTIAVYPQSTRILPEPT